MNVAGRFLRRRSHIPAFGGEVRLPVTGPLGIQARLARTAALRIALTAIILVVALVNLALAARMPSVMGTELFVADGSALGCHVPSVPAD